MLTRHSGVLLFAATVVCISVLVKQCCSLKFPRAAWTRLKSLTIVRVLSKSP